MMSMDDLDNETLTKLVRILAEEAIALNYYVSFYTGDSVKHQRQLVEFLQDRFADAGMVIPVQFVEV